MQTCVPGGLVTADDNDEAWAGGGRSFVGRGISYFQIPYLSFNSNNGSHVPLVIS